MCAVEIVGALRADENWDQSLELEKLNDAVRKCQRVIERQKEALESAEKERDLTIKLLCDEIINMKRTLEETNAKIKNLDEDLRAKRNQLENRRLQLLLAGFESPLVLEMPEFHNFG